jgi:hypothetical protein
MLPDERAGALEPDQSAARRSQNRLQQLDFTKSPGAQGR